MARIIIELCPDEPRTSACLVNGAEISTDETLSQDMADCRASGDVQEACEYVRDQVGVDWRIIARNADGAYENRAATDAEMEATARAIYFDSETDFSDVDTAATYLIWSAACDLESAGE